MYMLYEPQTGNGMSRLQVRMTRRSDYRIQLTSSQIVAAGKTRLLASSETARMGLSQAPKAVTAALREPGETYTRAAQPR